METEVFGVNYERFSVGKKLDKLAKKYHIRSVLEMPAHGAKAMPSIYSIGFAKRVKHIILVNGNPKYASEWEKIGAKERVSWVKQEDICHTRFKDASFDFVWNFAYLPACKEPDLLIDEMSRVSKTGFVDCPVWPDSLGFRDVRLHRMNLDFNKMDWEAPYVDMLKNGSFPIWMKLVYIVERLPLPKFLKSIYAHINYTIAEKVDDI